MNILTSPQIIRILKIMHSTQIKYSDTEYFDRGLPINKIAPTNSVHREIKRARDGSNKQETLVGMSGL